MATAFTSVKILEAEFITLNSSYLENGMFPIKSETSDPFFDLHAIATDESKIETLISEWSDDISFGKIYAIIGSFTFKEICGHLVVLAPDVVRECFKSPLSLQLICFSSKTVKCKISRRTKSSAAVLKKVSEILTFNLYQKTMTFLPNRINCSNPGREFIMSSWNSEFGTEPAILNGLDTSKILKRKHVAFLSKESAMNLIDSTDYFIPGPTLNQSKRLKTILEENSTSFSDTNYKKENKSKINLREEATSLVEGAFSHKWSPEKFVEGFHALKNKCLESKSQLAATVASVLMDASYRITDCTPIMEDDVITDVAIDVDQFVLKCDLKFPISENVAGGSDSQEPIQSSEHEKKFLREVYDTISEILVGSVNDTTSYCPNTISSAQSGRGSSLDNANQRGKYMSLCLSGVTSQVLNVSFRNKFSSPAKDKCYVQVKEASNTVIEFLLSAGTKFWNDYSLIHFNSMKLNWEEGKNEIFHVPGGLLFPILTAALISFRTEKGIAFVAESYGGKTRGKHLHWKFKEANRENISEIVNGINLIEETKVPFIVKNAFRAIQSKWPSSVKNVSIHWGLGSDAKGSILRSGKPSFLVCQPVNIDSVDTCRTGLTKDVFRNKNMSCSSTATRSEAGKVSSDSDTDSDSKLDEGVRQRWFLPSEHRHHSRFIPFGQLCPFNLHPVTHKVTKKSPPTGHEILDANKSLNRIQSYSPNLRSPHGTGGVQKIGETLMDIRTFVRTSDAMDKSYISLSEAAAKSAKWSTLARSHIEQLRTSCGMARLELTFLSKDLQSDKVFTDGISTVINTFVKSTKVYSAELVADLAEISLLGFEGVSSALLTWFQGSFISVPLCWNTFSEVWQYLTFVATNFFSGRRCYDRKAFFTPRLGYLFSRPVVNPSWVGINAALVQICSNEGNFLKLKNCWYESSGMTDYFNERRGVVNRNIIDLSGKFDTKFKAFLELLETRCDSAPITLNEAVACSYCKTITSKLKSETDDWKDHRCDAINPEMSTVINLKSPEFTKYLIELSKAFSASQKEAMEEILLSDQSCFLTGVAGSGKSYLLKCLYPSLILKHGYSSVFITATTNIAASNINGITLSRFMGLIVNDETDHMLDSAGEEFLRCLSKHHNNLERHKQDILQNVTLCEVIIIDEAGMCDLNTFCFLNSFLQFSRQSELPFGGVRIILVGDVLQLPPIAKVRKTPDFTRVTKSREGEFFFQSRVFLDNFFVAYLRENHRQADPLFLNALNQVRIGDSAVVDYLNNNIFQNKCTSWSTLDMARSKNKKLINDDKGIEGSNKVTLKKRIDWGFLLGYRNNMKYYDEEIFKKKLDNAPKSNFSDLVVCLEHAESDAYTEISCKGQRTYRCVSTGTISSTYKPLPAEVERHFNAKLPRVLNVYVGMPCRVTYRTSHANVCSNTIVVIKELVLDPSNSVESIIVATTSPDHNEITVTLLRVTITERYLSKGYIEEFATRTQFPIISSIGLLPWNLQCLTISDNIFYDNSRSCATEKSNKASLYAVMSRVISKDQISFLFPVSTHEIRNGVNLVAKKFDDQYRLRNGVIFKVAQAPPLI